MASKTTYELEVKIGAATSPGWKATLGKVESGLQGVNALSNKIMTGIAAGVTAAAATATYAISNAVDTYTSFEQEMATVQSISGASATEFLSMKEAALDAGSSTVFTATEAASALEYMSLAGWDVDTSISGLMPVLELAAATGKELQTTSDLVTDSMSALKIGVDELDMYLDKLVKTNNSANTSAEQLMEALVNTGGASRVLGADLDDTITALGILANNGQKGTEAGTALNAIFVRLAGNTTAIKELNRLGVDLWDNGKFVGFQEGLERIHEALSGLDDEQQALSLKSIAGVHHYTQMSYLIDAVGNQGETDTSAWDMLEGKVANSTGALENMYDITTDTLENAQKRLESAKEDMQIRLVDVFSDDAKDFVSWLAESLPHVTESIVDFAEAHQREFAEALEGLGEGIENLWEFGIAAGQWIIRHKGAVTGALSGMATGMVLLKTATMGLNIAKFFTNPISAAVTAAGLAITAFTGIRGALRDAEEAAVSADLASHFGSIALSMEDIEQVAKHIVGSDSLTGMLNALEQFDELDSISAVMEDAVKNLDKMNWKVSIGMELTDGEKESYKKAIDDYISSAQEYAEQTQYAVSLNLEYAFGESFSEADSIEAKVTQFYADNSATLRGLAKSLNETMTEAFNDGLLDIWEIEKITNIQRQMADIQKAMAVGELEGQMSALSLEYSGKELTPESFRNLEEELNKLANESMETYKESYANNYSAIKATFEAGDMSPEEYGKAVNELQATYANDRAETQMRVMDFLLNTVYETYGDEIGQYEEVRANVIAKYSDVSYDANWINMPGSTFDTMLQDIASEGPNKESRHAVGELLESMSTSKAELYALKDEWDNLSPEIQRSVQTIIDRLEVAQGMSLTISDLRKGEDAEGLYRNIANEVHNSDDDTNMKGFVDQYYEELTGYTMTAVSGIEGSIEASKSETIQPAIDGIYAFSQEYLEQVFSQELSASTSVNLTVDPVFNMTGLAGWYNKHSSIYHNAEGGIYNSPILTTFAEEGPEAAVPLDGSPRAKQLWMHAGQILGMLPSDTLNRPYGELHQASSEIAWTEILQSRIGETEQAYHSIVNDIYNSGDSLDSRKIYNMTGHTSRYSNYSSIYHNAEGGIYNSPILTTFAEEGPEAAVPLDGSPRAKQLWMQAGQILGMLPDGTRDQVLLSGISNIGSREEAGKNVQIIFSPIITIQGSASREEVRSALTLSIDELREMLTEIQREDKRAAFG